MNFLVTSVHWFESHAFAHGFGGPGGMHLGMTHLLIMLGIAATAAIVFSRHRSHSPVPADSPLDFLNRRYAAGLIDESTYKAMRRALR